MSEFGFQAFPTLKTIEFYTEPEDRNLTSKIMEYHQRGNHGNGLIISQMTDMFKMPTNFKAWIYLSHVLQAEGIRYGVEHWRRNLHRVSGTLYWQLNDCWPVSSWSSIDYFGRWKALQYASRRFYAPLLISIEDENHFMKVHVTNDHHNIMDCLVKWSFERLDGLAEDSGVFEVSVLPHTNMLVNSFNFKEKLSKLDEEELILVYELWQSHSFITYGVSTFVPNKYLKLSDPALEFNLSRQKGVGTISLKSKSLARFVELNFEGEDVVFSDNYFDLPANRCKEVTFQFPSGWSLEKAQNELTVYSLVDSYD